jgi:hypothetical protein
MIQFEILFFFMSCVNLTCDIVLKTLVTFKFNKMIIQFVFYFHTMWICSMKSFKIVLINRFFRHVMNVSSNNRCVFVIHEIFLLMMNSKFFRWCSITRLIDTFSKSCNLFYRFSSTWWFWFFWTFLNDTFVVCKRRITKWAIASWWKHKFWTICWWFRRNSKFYWKRFVW